MGLSAVLQQKIELAEHLGEVPAVDLVDDEKVLSVRVILSLPGDPHERPVLEPESRLPIVKQRRAVALHEILVRIGRMELDDLAALPASGKTTGQLLRDVRLPGAGRPLENDLFLFPKQRFDVLKEFDREVQLLGNRHQSVDGRWQYDLIGSARSIQRPPDDRLRIQPVAHRKTPRLGFRDEPGQKAERVLVQFRLVRAFRRGWVTRLLVGSIKCQFGVWRVFPGILSHEQERDEVRSGSCAAYDACRKFLAEHLDTLRQWPAIRCPKRPEST